MIEYKTDQIGYFKELPDGLKARPIDFRNERTVVLTPHIVFDHKMNQDRVAAAHGGMYMPPGFVETPALKPRGVKTKKIAVK